MPGRRQGHGGAAATLATAMTVSGPALPPATSTCLPASRCLLAAAACWQRGGGGHHACKPVVDLDDITLYLYAVYAELPSYFMLPSVSPQGWPGSGCHRLQSRWSPVSLSAAAPSRQSSHRQSLVLLGHIRHIHRQTPSNWPDAAPR